MEVKQQHVSHKARNKPERCFQYSFESWGHAERIPHPHTSQMNNVICAPPHLRAVRRRLNPELVKLGLKSRALQAQPRRRAVGSAEPAVAFPKSAQNAFAFSIAKIVCAAAIVAAKAGLQFRKRRLQN